MLLRNDLLQYVGEVPRTVRILWVDSALGLAYTYALDLKTARPCAAALDVLTSDVQSGRASLLSLDPYRTAVDPETLPLKYLALRANAWAIVSALTTDEPALFEARTRSQLVAACCDRFGVSHPTVYRYLRRYWTRGQHPDALLPDYANSGAPGKIRRANAGVKRGRPSKSGVTAPNADDAVRDTIRAASLRYAAMHADFSRPAAYRQMLGEYFPGGQSVPSYGQFCYWLDREGIAPLIG